MAARFNKLAAGVLRFSRAKLHILEEAESLGIFFLRPYTLILLLEIFDAWYKHSHVMLMQRWQH